MLDVHVRMYLYRWDGGGGAEDSLESATEPYHMRARCLIFGPCPVMPCDGNTSSDKGPWPWSECRKIWQEAHEGIQFRVYRKGFRLSARQFTSGSMFMTSLQSRSRMSRLGNFRAPQELDVGHETGADRLCLRLPALVTHRITADSALAHWNEPGGILQDADSEIVVVVRLCSGRQTWK